MEAIEETNTGEFFSTAEAKDIDSLNLSMLLQKINRILSENENVVVVDSTKSKYKVSTGMAEPSDDMIYLNFDTLRKIARQDIIKFLTITKGVNYHELAHVMFTDMSKSIIEDSWTNKYRDIAIKQSNSGKIYNDIVTMNVEDIVDYKKLQTPLSTISIYDFTNAMNLLEDTRIENLFSTLFDRAKYYFSMTAISIIMESRKKQEGNELPYYLVLYGRKFLNVNLKNYRESSKNDFITEDVIKECEKLVDSYIVEKDVHKRMDITFELALIFNKSKQVVNQMSGLPSILSKNRSRGKNKRMEDAIDKLKNSIKNRKEIEDDVESVETDSHSEIEESSQVELGENPDSNQEEIDASREDKELSSRKHSRSGKSQHTEDETESGGSNAKTSVHKTTKSDSENILKILKKMKEKIDEGMEQIEVEITNDMNTLSSLVDKDEFAVYDGLKFNAGKIEKYESRKIENILKLLKGDLALSIKRFQKSGQLDMYSALRSQRDQSLEVFKRLRLNKLDKSKIGVCILLDSSGSISDDEFRNEIKAAWCLSDAFKNLDNKVEVIEFSSTHRILKHFNNEGDWSRNLNRGGTAVVKPIEQGFRDLLSLKRKEGVSNLMMIVVSDGEFDEGYERVAAEFRKLRKSGIKVVWIYASPNDYRTDIDNNINKSELARETDTYISMNSLHQLSRELKQLVIKIQKDIIRGIQHGTFYN